MDNVLTSCVNIEDRQKTNKSKIRCLDGIRVILALMIFLHHSGALVYPYQECIWSAFWSKGFSDATLPLMAFFFISGIVISINYKEKFAKLSFRSYFEFIAKRFLKIYLAYILSFIFCTLISYYQSKCDPLFWENNGNAILCGIFMLQTIYYPFWWIGNPAGWFIATLFVLYCFTPLIIFFTNKIFISKKRALIGLITVLLLSFGLYLFCALYFRTPDGTISDDLVMFFSRSPATRLLQFYIGILLGYYISYNKRTICKTTATILEVSALIVFGVFQFLNINVFKINAIFNESIDYFVVTLFLFIFCFDSGYVSAFFGLKPFRFLSSCSFEFYLFHFALTKIVFFDELMKHFEATNISILFVWLTWLVASFALAFLVHYVNEILYKKIVSKGIFASSI